ncbi:MAG: lipase [Candidatus Faecalibacterium intestinavium]|uniref:Lipase n=1 Tax=Candidatus Faecalibacterium intestinavium TaxID=2838580 RepID=A0A9E2KJM8_9FIRM|nr:lipase [Candidatus Faecalibacterium intestinavium]
MSPTQKQAVLVCVVCALAILLTASITWVLIGRKGAQPPDASSAVLPEEDDLSEYYQIDETSTAVLPETADAGEEYLADTLFLGDSNTVRYYNNGLISLQQFCAKEGIGIQAALSEPIVAFKNDSNRYTIPQAVAMMKPRRVVIMLGTNDNGMSVDAFISHYTALVQAIQSAYPYTDIIVNTVPPVPQSHSNYPDMEQSKIDDFNMALLSMCESLGVKFLNSTEVLKDSTGYGNPDYYISGDIHLKNSGLKAILNYLRTHAWLTEDRRPDTSNIPTRVIDYTSNPSDAVEAPEQDPEVLFEARYQIDQNVGGTLTGAESGQTSLVYGISDPSETITVTAVPDPGYVFVKWSDGLTAKTRTDTDFKQNLDVTAVFAAASVQISSEGSGILGMNYTFKATLSGKYTSADTLRWFVNGEEYTDVAGMTTISFLVDPVLANQSYKVYAVASYNDCEIVSNTLTVSFKGGVSSEETSSSSSSSGSSSSGSSKPAASDSEEQEEPASRPAAAESESASSSSGSASSSKPASSDSSSSGSASSSKPASSDSSSSSASSSKPASSNSSSSSASSSKPASSNSSSGSASSSKPASSAAEDPLGDALSGVFDLFETNEKPASRG